MRIPDTDRKENKKTSRNERLLIALALYRIFHFLTFTSLFLQINPEGHRSILSSTILNTKFLQFIFYVFAFLSLQNGEAAAIKTLSPFTEIAGKRPELDQRANRYKILSLNRVEVQKVFLNEPGLLNLSLPGPDGQILLQFEANEVHASDFKVLNSTNKNVTSTLEMPLHFKGVNNQRGKEMAALSLFSNGDLVLVFSNHKGNFNCSRLPDSKTGEYLIFNESDLKIKNPFHCGTEGRTSEQESEKRSTPNTPHIQDDTSCRLTEIYWECDHDMFTKGGNSIQGALNQFEAMFNGTAILYENESINIGVKAVKVWDTPDPYSYNSSFTALGDFRDAGNAANWPGQLAHLLSTRPLNLGGVAWLDAICSSFRYGFSNIDFLFQPLPVYSWTISTIAHELGHNFSSNHTHNCNWQFPNGDIHQIDSCWNAEGDCQPVIRGRIGTIMSYCHLTGSVNLALGFGPLPGNRIREGFADMSCQSGSIVVPPFTPINSGPYCIGDTLQLSSEDLTGYSYRWTGPNGFVSTEREPKITSVSPSSEGFYTLVVKKSACESRPKKTEAVFNCLQVGTLPLNLCAGSLLSVPLTTTGVFNSGNKFIAQLSNAVGNFSNPMNLDTIEGSVPQTYSLFIPASISLGNAFKIRFLSTSPAYEGKPTKKSFGITAAGVAPTPINGERCGPGSLKISASGGTNFSWFSNPLDLLPLTLSKVYETPVLTQTKSYYVQASATVRNKAGLSKDLATGSFSNATDGLVFDVLGGFRLDSITLVAQVSTQPSLVTLQLVANNSVLYQTLVNIDTEVKKVALFWRIDPGTNYQLLCSGDNMLRKAASNWGVFPKKINGLLSIKSSISNSTTNDYPYIFDWIVQKYAGCPSKKVEVKAIIRQGEPPVVPTVNLAGMDSVICSQPGLSYEWLINGVVFATPLRKFKGIVNTSYQVRYKTDSCFSDWSPQFTFTISSNSELTEMANPAVFPNPTQSQLIWTGINEPAEIFLVDVAGKEIWHRKVMPEDRLEVSALPGGIYGIKWQTQDASGFIRFGKE